MYKYLRHVLRVTLLIWLSCSKTRMNFSEFSKKKWPSRGEMWVKVREKLVKVRVKLLKNEGMSKKKGQH
jgi:hypothetical protein